MGTGISVNENHIKKPHIGDTTILYGDVFHAVGIDPIFGTLKLKPEAGQIHKDLDRNQITIKSNDTGFTPEKIGRGKSGFPQLGSIPKTKPLDTEHFFHDRPHITGDK